MERRSETIGELATALALAQGELEAVSKDSQNPHFQHNYAGLSSVLKAARPALSKNGFCVVQIPVCDGQKVTITTILMHRSGEWIAGDLTMTAREASPQSIGSVITYGRRYGYLAVIGLAPEDDDGEAGEGRGKQKGAQTQAQKEVLDRKLRDMKDGGMKRAAPPPIPEPPPDHGLGVGVHDISLEDQLKASIRREEQRKQNNSRVKHDPVYREMLEGFRHLRTESAKIGKEREVYYGGLGYHGYEHANEIPDIETGRTVYKYIAGRLSEAKGMVDAEEEAVAMREQ